MAGADPLRVDPTGRSLFGFTPAERAQQTGISAQTIYRRANQFDTVGMRSLFESGEPPDSRRLLPSTIRRVIAELKAEYPPFRPNEVATICFVRFNRRPSRTTIQKIWADEPASSTSRRRFPPYATIRDPVQRRGAIIRLHAEGWNIASIAGYLETSRPTVYATLQRWIEEGVHGLTDRPPMPVQPATTMTLQAIEAIRKLQVNPLLGEFRIHAALLQMGIRLSPRTCGRILQRNRKLYRLRHASDHEPQEMPFKATRRHQYWTVDIRYIDHQIDEANVYVIAILENYSRAMVASAITRTQNLTAYLRVLHAAVSRYGAPEALVTDGGAVFRAKQAGTVYRALGIRKEQIARRQPWQSYIETAFNIQRRMADWHFAQATTWDELKQVHERWMVDYNYQSHWAHQKRQDGRRSPADVLGWVTARPCDESDLRRVFTPRYERLLDQVGYARFRHWRIYGERGLSGKRATLWLYEDHLALQFTDALLAEYGVEHQEQQHRFKSVQATTLYATRYQSPQPWLWAMPDDEWLKALPLPLSIHRPRATPEGHQLSLFEDAPAPARTG